MNVYSILSVIWLCVLTILFIRMIRHYNRLTEGITKTGLREVLETIIQTEDALKKRTFALEEKIRDVIEEGTVHIQRVGIVRFNPFADTGGSQSFTIAFLDGQDNGVVLTSLYARTGNRWYLKEIIHGKGKNIELSSEEQTAIRQAKKT